MKVVLAPVTNGRDEWRSFSSSIGVCRGDWFRFRFWLEQVRCAAAGRRCPATTSLFDLPISPSAAALVSSWVLPPVLPWAAALAFEVEAYSEAQASALAEPQAVPVEPQDD